jgi:hypothetical protein
VGIYVFLVVRLEEMDYIEVSLWDAKGWNAKLSRVRGFQPRL